MIMLVALAIFMTRFFALTQEAHNINVEITAKAMQAAVFRAHAKWLVKGQPTSVPPIAGLDFLDSGYANVGFNEQGWPDAANTGKQDIRPMHILGHGGNDDCVCAQIMKNLMPFSSITIGSGNYCTQSYCATYHAGVCTYTYQQHKKVSRKIHYSPQDGDVTNEKKKAKYRSI
ncbi:MAG: hypothetical protein JSS07_02775 [Proteobacteria bacterium]|nr:hypothetical protein [Pseudomonadota bacterium]